MWAMVCVPRLYHLSPPPNVEFPGAGTWVPVVISGGLPPSLLGPEALEGPTRHRPPPARPLREWVSAPRPPTVLLAAAHDFSATHLSGQREEPPTARGRSQEPPLLSPEARPRGLLEMQSLGEVLAPLRRNSTFTTPPVVGAGGGVRGGGCVRLKVAEAVLQSTGLGNPFIHNPFVFWLLTGSFFTGKTSQLLTGPDHGRL